MWKDIHVLNPIFICTLYSPCALRVKCAKRHKHTENILKAWSPVLGSRSGRERTPMFSFISYSSLAELVRWGSLSSVVCRMYCLRNHDTGSIKMLTVVSSSEYTRTISQFCQNLRFQILEILFSMKHHESEHFYTLLHDWYIPHLFNPFLNFLCQWYSQKYCFGFLKFSKFLKSREFV